MEVAPAESATRWVPAAASSRSLSANTAAVIWATASSISRISRPVSVTAETPRTASRASRQASTATTTGCAAPVLPAPSPSASPSTSPSVSSSRGPGPCSDSAPVSPVFPACSVLPAVPFVSGVVGSGADPSRADPSGADLSGADLSGADAPGSEDPAAACATPGTAHPPPPGAAVSVRRSVVLTPRT
ncbi:MAG: pentapeptide repeat-containing protein [Nocardioidaceae bacterium]